MVGLSSKVKRLNSLENDVDEAFGPKGSDSPQEDEANNHRGRPSLIEGSAEHIYEHITSIAQGKEKALITESRALMEEARAAMLEAEKAFKLVEESVTGLTVKGPLDKDTGEVLAALLKAVHHAVCAAKELNNVGGKLVDELAVLKLTKLRIVSAITKADLTERFARKSARKAGEAQSAVNCFAKFIKERAKLYRGDLFDLGAQEDEEKSYDNLNTSKGLLQEELNISDNDTSDSCDDPNKLSSRYSDSEMPRSESDSKIGLKSCESHEELGSQLESDTQSDERSHSLKECTTREETTGQTSRRHSIGSAVLYTHDDSPSNGMLLGTSIPDENGSPKLSVTIDDTEDVNGEYNSNLNCCTQFAPVDTRGSECYDVIDETSLQRINEVQYQFCEVPVRSGGSKNSILINRENSYEENDTTNLGRGADRSPITESVPDETDSMFGHDRNEVIGWIKLTEGSELENDRLSVLTNPDDLRVVLDILRETGVEPDGITLETIDRMEVHSSQGKTSDKCFTQEKLVEEHTREDSANFVVKLSDDPDTIKSVISEPIDRKPFERSISEDVCVTVENDDETNLNTTEHLEELGKEANSEIMNEEGNILPNTRHEEIQITIVTNNDTLSELGPEVRTNESNSHDENYYRRSKNLSRTLSNSIDITSLEKETRCISPELQTNSCKYYVQNVNNENFEICVGTYPSSSRDNMLAVPEFQSKPHVIRSISQYVDARFEERAENPDRKGTLSRLRSNGARRGSDELGTIIENVELKVSSPVPSRPVSRSGTQKRRPLRRSISEVIKDYAAEIDIDGTTDSYCLPEGASSAPTLLADDPPPRHDFRRPPFISQMSYTSGVSIAGFPYDISGFGMTDEEKFTVIGAEAAAACAAAAAASAVGDAAVAGMHATIKAKKLIAIYIAAHDRIEEQSSMLAEKLKTKMKLMRMNSRRSSCSSCSSRDSSIIIVGTVERKRWMIGTISCFLFAILLTYALL